MKLYLYALALILAASQWQCTIEQRTQNMGRSLYPYYGTEVETWDPSKPEDRKVPAEDGGQGRTGWAITGELITGEAEGSVSLQAQFAEPGYYTIHFGVEFPKPSFATITDIEAEIAFSLEGSTIRRRMNVGNGSAISGIGQAVDVDVYDVTHPDIANSKPYKVSIHVSKGVRPVGTVPPTLHREGRFVNGQPPDYGIFFYDLPPNSSTINRIPLDVGVVSAEVTIGPNGGGDFPIEGVFVEQSSLPIGALKRYDPQVITGFVAIVPGAQDLNIINTSTKNYKCQITFGIEG